MFRISGIRALILVRISIFGFHSLGSWRPFGGVYPFDSLRAGSDKGRAQDRPFDIPAVRPELVEGDGWLAQDRLGAKSFVEVFLLNILSEKSNSARSPSWLW